MLCFMILTRAAQIFQCSLNGAYVTLTFANTSKKKERKEEKKKALYMLYFYKKWTGLSVIPSTIKKMYNVRYLFLGKGTH